MDGLIGAVRRLLGGYEIGSLTPLGAGTDHDAYDLDGVFVVRRRRPVEDDDGPAAVEREVRVLEAVARVSPIPVPTVVAAAPEQGLLVLRRLPGTSLLAEPCPDPDRLVEQVAGFLAAVYALPADLVEPDDHPLSGYLAEAAEAVARIAPVLDAGQRALVEEFLATTPPPEPTIRLFCHADLGAEHLLAEPTRTRLTGVLDWSDAAGTDPARDLGRLYRDLGPGPAARIRDALTGLLDDGALSRAAFHARCALVEDLAFGLDEGDHRYARAALTHLPRTFQQPA
ncbi:phosphotransferase family protein [Micromonospora fluostatini]